MTIRICACTRGLPNLASPVQSYRPDVIRLTRRAFRGMRRALDVWREQSRAMAVFAITIAVSMPRFTMTYLNPLKGLRSDDADKFPTIELSRFLKSTGAHAAFPEVIDGCMRASGGSSSTQASSSQNRMCMARWPAHVLLNESVGPTTASERSHHAILAALAAWQAAARQVSPGRAKPVILTVQVVAL
jgi:hypothetical protein